jgi:hypothetical protein
MKVKDQKHKTQPVKFDGIKIKFPGIQTKLTGITFRLEGIKKNFNI